MRVKQASTHSTAPRTLNATTVTKTVRRKSETSPRSATASRHSEVGGVDASEPDALVRPCEQEGVVVVAGPTPRAASQLVWATLPVCAGESHSTKQEASTPDVPTEMPPPAMRRGSEEERRAVLAALDKAYGRGHNASN